MAVFPDLKHEYLLLDSYLVWLKNLRILILQLDLATPYLDTYPPKRHVIHRTVPAAIEVKSLAEHFSNILVLPVDSVCVACS